MNSFNTRGSFGDSIYIRPLYCGHPYCSENPVCHVTHYLGLSSSSIDVCEDHVLWASEYLKDSKRKPIFSDSNQCFCYTKGKTDSVVICPVHD